MATTFLDPGTDHTQDFTFWPIAFESNGTRTSATDQAHTGARSIKSNVTSSGGEANFESIDGILADAGGAVSFWLRVSTAGPATKTMLFSTLQAGDNNIIFSLGLNTNGTLFLQGDGCSVKNGATTVPANTWVRITLAYIVTSSSNFTAKLYLNGGLEATTTQADGTLASVTTSHIKGGIQGWPVLAPTPAVMTAWYDDFYVDDRTDLTDPGTTDAESLRVTCKLPSADGTATEFTTAVGAASGAHFDDVAERPANAANGWSISTTTRKTEEYTVQNAATGDVNLTGKMIRAVMGYVVAKVDSTANSPVHRLIVDGTPNAITLTTAAAPYLVASATPTGLPAGTGTDIGLDAQYTATPHVTSLLECGILVAFDGAATRVPYNNYYAPMLTQ